MAARYALVIEDDPLVAELFQRALQDAGYQAEIMENGHKAQAQLVFTTPDLVVVDIHLPNLSGGILLRQVRGQQRFWHTRIIVVSGDAEAAKEFEPLADEVVVKPVGYEKIRRLAEQFIPATIE
jgi:DNA-binding response OmpR family regulator